jgi:hypothetical protein
MIATAKAGRSLSAQSHCVVRFSMNAHDFHQPPIARPAHLAWATCGALITPALIFRSGIAS